MSVHAGDLRHSVALQRYTSTTGDRGQPVKTWTTYATVPAMIEELTGRKLELARQQVATATHKITLRYYSGVTVKDRVLYDGKAYGIGDITDRNLMHFSLELLATTQEVGA